MKLIIKSKPEDFVVEEIAKFAFKPKGDFGIYLLKKSNWNTVGALLDISKKAGVAFRDFSYGGKKDRHALTSQYISVKGPRLKDIKQAEYSLVFRGYLDRPMGPDLIAGNSFRVVVRGLSQGDIKLAMQEAVIVKDYGFVNYFDDQRFGSFDHQLGFLAEKLLKNHFNGALKIYFTPVNFGDNKQERQRKEILRKSWGNWKLCKTLARSGFEKKAFDHLIKKPSGFLYILRQVSREKLSIYFSAYQAFIWNEIAREFLKEKASGPLKIYPGVAGDYLFFQRLSAEENNYLKDLSIPTLASRVKMPDELSAKIFSRILISRGIKNSMFNNLKTRQAFFKSSERKIIIRPQDFSFEDLADDTDGSKRKAALCFRLPRASYATMLVKRLFCNEKSENQG